MIFLDSFVLSKQYNENPVYETKTAFIKDLITTYREVIQGFYDIGCRYLQSDDTSWSGLFEDRFRSLIANIGYDPDELIQEFFCKGNFQSHWLYNDSYDKIAKRLLSIEAFAGFFLEFDDERSGSFEPLQNIKDQRIVLGLVTTKTPELEDKVALKARIKEASQYVPLNQL